MILTLKKLKELNACKKGLKWFKTSTCTTVEEACENLMAEDGFAWANWLLVRLFTRDNAVRYALFAAKQVLPIYEKEYPTDPRVRDCITAIERYLTDPTDENKELLKTAAYAAAAASDTAYAAIAASDNAYASAFAADYAAAASANAAAAASDTTYAASDNAIYYAAVKALPTQEFKQRIIRNGLKLLKEQEGNK